VEGKELKGDIYHGPSACLLQAPRLSADFPPSLDTHCGCSLNAIRWRIKMADQQVLCPSKNSMHSAHGQLTPHHVGVTAGTLQWSLSLPPSCLAGGGNCHRDTAVVAQCLVGTVLPSSWVPAVIKYTH